MVTMTQFQKRALMEPRRRLWSFVSSSLSNEAWEDEMMLQKSRSILGNADAGG